jgi:2-(1,2-epoxy-1,2-dihydrophenyl)acetyl-CoA isomerase
MTQTAAADPVGVRFDADGAVLTITLDRPETGNALRQQECSAVREAVQQADGGGPVRAILIRSEGRHFCTGADLTSANAVDAKPTAGRLSRGLALGAHGMIDALWDCPVPTVAAVQGTAIGLGLHLAIACDFTVAAEDATFAELFCKRGFSVDSGGSFLLPRLVGLRRAKQMLLRGIPVDAPTAADWGLVDEVVAGAELTAAAGRLAAELAAGPTFSLGHTKRLLNHPAGDDLGEALRQEAASVEATIRSADFKEGLRAFSEKRDPVFGGH